MYRSYNNLSMLKILDCMYFCTVMLSTQYSTYSYKTHTRDTSSFKHAACLKYFNVHQAYRTHMYEVCGHQLLRSPPMMINVRSPVWHARRKKLLHMFNRWTNNFARIGTAYLHLTAGYTDIKMLIDKDLFLKKKKKKKKTP